MTSTELVGPVEVDAEVTELDTDAVEAELAEIEPLTERQAKALDKRIRAASDKLTNNVNQLWDFLEEAVRGQIHVALGVSSCEEYIKDAVQFRPADKVERKALVAFLSAKRLSQRAIAAALGVSKGAVQADQKATGQNCPVESTGLDGKSRKNKPKESDKPEPPLDVDIVEPRPEPEHPPEPPVTQDFRDEMYNLLNNVQAFRDILDDERYPKARKRIAKTHLGTLQEAIAGLQSVADDLIDAAGDGA